MIQRFFTYFTVLVFVISTIASPAIAQNLQSSAVTPNHFSQSIGSETVNSECSHMNDAEMANMPQGNTPDMPFGSDDCCKQKCACKMNHCSISVLPFGSSGFSTLVIRIEKSGLPKTQVFASTNLDPLKRPPRI